MPKTKMGLIASTIGYIYVIGVVLTFMGIRMLSPMYTIELTIWRAVAWPINLFVEFPRAYRMPMD